MSISLVLEARYAQYSYALSGDEYSGLNWLDDAPKPSEAELLSQVDDVLHEIAVRSIEQARQAAYQIESDPLFFKYQRNEDGVTKAAWLAKVEEIRERYPMPEAPAE